MAARVAFLLFVVPLAALLASAQLHDLQPFALEDVVNHAHDLAAKAPAPTPLFGSKRDYLDVIAPVFEHFLQYQNLDFSSKQFGRIIDPYAGVEIQYATPCFAHTGARLLKEQYYAPGDDKYNLALERVTFAMDAALKALAFGQPSGEDGCAQGHCNFYTMPLMLALEALQDIAPRSQLYTWYNLATQIDPHRAYNGWPQQSGNWGVVALTGEFLKFKLGLTPNTTTVDEIEEQLAHNDERWTANGEYQDFSGCDGTCSPMPYDHFPRKYITVLLAYGYDFSNASAHWELNRRGAWVSLLLQSPWGELPTGGRSSQHQWNEAVSCVTYEFWASHLSKQGDAVSAGMFKRAAALSLMSLRRWKRETGDWYIVKNRVDPALRHGYEGYSFDTQYNLLPASMLASAFLFADDSIKEGASIAETGGFAFSPELMHKVVVNTAGMYGLVELFPDAPSHDTLGLTRLHHRSTDPLITLTAGAARSYGPQFGLGPGLFWTQKLFVNAIAEVVDSSVFSPAFPATNLLSMAASDEGEQKVWLLPQGKLGGVTFDLGAICSIDEFLVRNTRINNFATSNLTISIGTSESELTRVANVWLSDPATSGFPDYMFRCNNMGEPCVGRYVRVDITAFYGDGGGLNVFRMVGSDITDHPVPVEQLTHFADATYLDVVDTKLALPDVSKQTTSDIQFSVTDTLGSGVSVQEHYDVNPNEVVVTSSLLSTPANLTQFGLTYPVFYSDGVSRGTVTITRTPDLRVLTAFPGSAASMLGTTCMMLEVISEHPDGCGEFRTDKSDPVVSSRNGFMSSVDITCDVAHASEGPWAVMYRLTPLGEHCEL